MKKKYMKPSMKVYELEHRPQMLIESLQDWSNPIGYNPGIDAGMNKTA